MTIGLGGQFARREQGKQLLEKVGVRAGDALPERLKLEPSRQVRTDQRVSILRSFVGNSLRLAGGLSKKLRLARAVHSNEPPGGFVDGVADGEQAVISQDDRLLGSESSSDTVTFGSFFNDAGVIVEDRVIFVEGAGILRERIEAAAERGPRLAVKRMRVRGCDHVGAGGVNARVNGKRGKIHFRVAFDHSTGVIHEDQIGDANLAEMQTEGIDPKTIEALGIARGDVAGDAFVKTIFSEEAKGGGEAFFAMAALLGG